MEKASTNASVDDVPHIVSDSNDVGAYFVAGIEKDLDPQEALRIR
jgi:hypothetical protein